VEKSQQLSHQKNDRELLSYFCQTTYKNPKTFSRYIALPLLAIDANSLFCSNTYPKNLMFNAIILTPKSLAERDLFIEQSTQNYTAEISKTYDISIEEGKKMADSQIKQALDSKNGVREIYIASIIDETTKQTVGGIWYTINKENLKAYVFQITIDEPHRGKGYGRKALTKVHQYCKSQKVISVSLSAFGWNQPAFKLYESLGYKVLRYGMRKDL